MKYNNINTKAYNKININSPLNEYPNPQFKRNSYYSLNGKWNYKITKNISNLDNIDKTIIVPYPIESKASQVNTKLEKDEYIIYYKSFNLDKNFIKENTFITFLGVDQEFSLIINGHTINNLIPLNNPIRIDISKYIKEENDLYVIVKDNLNYIFPLGKQSKKPKGIFYTPFSGIYYPVYLESLENNYIEDIKISTSINSVSLSVFTSSDKYEVIIKENNQVIHDSIYKEKEIRININNPILWDINNPFLYNLIIKTETDCVESYFGLREIKLINNIFYLNNKEIFLNGLLNQGYYPESIITPPSYQLLEYEIKLVKELGFNTLREHIKLDVPYFYYLCDKYGILVLQDFINNGKYNFLTQTALPTIGLSKKNDKCMNNNQIQRKNFITCAEMIINNLHNHPCIVGYTIFNEGWGQFDSDNVYDYFKNKYPNLIFDSTSGWFIQTKSDLNSYHWYFKNLSNLQTTNKIIFLSEFGALCYKYKDHCYSDKKVFAYTYFNSLNELEKAYIDLFKNKIIPYKDKINGCIYTQLTDIEEEDNGLLTYDREILKINKDIIIEINKLLEK